MPEDCGIRGNHRIGRQDDSGLVAGVRYANRFELESRVQAHARRVAAEEAALAERMAVNRAAALARVYTGEDRLCRACQTKYPLTEPNWRLGTKTGLADRTCRHCHEARERAYNGRRTELARAKRAAHRRAYQLTTKSPYRKKAP